MSNAKSIKDILKNFNPFEDKYIRRQYQAFGVYLAEKLEDPTHKSLYIKMARDLQVSRLNKHQKTDIAG